jgi:serine/threonine protein kinase/Tol biopolymer transport system component
VIGRSLSHYQVLEEISRGGMGIVYKALDLRLNREVALKVLPPDLVSDPERKRRLVQEAQAAAALKHPNIATVYEIDEVDGVDFIAMELIEGDTLGKLIANGALTTSRAIDIAIETVDGLASAHDQGIVHRDLKPGNILISAGHPKIIDFGLAKLVEATSRSTDTSDEEEATAVRGETHPGTVLGTFSYMSPEQARGGSVDARSDLFSFGIVLFHMLSGKLPFTGATSADTLSSILKDPTPRIDGAGGNGALQPILDKCLAKDPNERYATARELLEDLKNAREAAGAPTPKRRLTPVVVMATGLGLAAALLWLRPSSPPVATPTFRLANPVQVTTSLGVEEEPSWSPDGSMLAFSAGKPGVRGAMAAMAEAEADIDIWISQVAGGAPINRTADYLGVDRFAAWSPDGTQIAFWSSRDGGGYYIMPALAGAARRIGSAARTVGVGGALAWSADGSELACIVYDETLQVSAEIIDLETSATRSIALPGRRDRRYYLSWSPNGRFFAYVDGGAINDDVNRLVILDNDAGTTHPLSDDADAAWSATWSPDSRTVYYVSTRGGATMDLWQQAVSQDGVPEGAPIPLTTGVGMRQAAVFSPTQDKLAYSQGRLVANLWRVPIPRGADHSPVGWSEAEQLTFENAHVQFFDLSVDERQIVVSSNRSGNFDLWVLPSGGGELSPLTTDPGHDWAPAWSPDGREIAFYSFRTGDREIWIQPVSGGAARQLTTDGNRNQFPRWSPDGRDIYYVSSQFGNRNIWARPVAGDGPSRQITDGEYPSTWPQLSPDGALVAFNNQNRVWVVPSEGGEPRQLGSTTYRFPVWSRDGRLVYTFGGRGGTIASVSIDDGTERLVADLSGRPGALGIYGLGAGREHLYFLWDQDIGDIWVMDVVTDDTE